MYTSLHNNIYAPVRKIDAQVEFFTNAQQTIQGALTKDITHTPEGHLKSITINRDGDLGKFFGFGVIQKANVKLMDAKLLKHRNTKDVMKISFKSSADEAFFSKYPNFFITETHTKNDMNEQSITAYDALYFTNLIKFKEIQLTTPYSIKEIVARIAIKIGLSSYELRKVVNTTAFNVNYPNGANFGEEATVRDVLDDIAEATQTIYFIEGNKLIFKGLSSANDLLSLNKKHYFNLTAKDNRKLTKIASVTDLGDNVDSPPVCEKDTGQVGTTQFVRNNGFWDLRKDIAQLLSNAITAIGNLTLAQFNLEWRGNYLAEIGDRIAVECNNSTINSFLLNDTIEYTGGLVEKTNWEYQDNSTEEASNPSTIGDALNKTFARVDKVNREISLVASKVEENTKKIASLKIDPDAINALVSKVEANSNNLATLDLTINSISQSVSQVQKNVDAGMEGVNGRIDELENKVSLNLTPDDVRIEVSQQIAQGVEQVTTSTGFTFNQAGLNISKNTTDISTQITEDGMQINQGGNALLVANHEGVSAKNLHATTYLIIGENSRFEDYDNGRRTGCFWIGY